MSDIHDKIRKLLALAEGKANEHESAQAMAFASALMMKHGIDAAQLKKTDKHAIIDGDRFDLDARWMIVAGQAVGELFGTKIVTSKWPKETIRFVGRSENVDASQDTLAFVLLQIERAYKIALPKGLTKGERATWRKDFKMAAAMRVLSRCQQIVAEQIKPTVATNSTGSTALVVVAHRQQLNEEISAHFEAAGVTTSRAMQIKYKSSGAVGAGRAAGNNVELNAKVR